MHGNMVLMGEITVKYEEKKKEREDNKEKEGKRTTRRRSISLEMHLFPMTSV